ncbi:MULTISPECIES: hypothetical protein [unclassified Rhizobium]|uniref:hypothetical protein n=1 Tax=unclassified Rhizobium TaxID=2613769 RepID=UPI001FD9FF03|nr:MULTISPECIES: hypothetical protein [unclassified Rhizobium]
MHALQFRQLVAEGFDLGAKLRVVGTKILVFGDQAKIVLIGFLARVAFVIEKRADARAFGAQRAWSRSTTGCGSRAARKRAPAAM